MSRRSFFDGSGYFFNDDTCSGGIKTEDDTLACAHCEAGLRKRDWLAAGGFKCHSCDQSLCTRCAAAPPQIKCSGPFKATIERALAEHYRREQNAKILGI